MIVARHRQELEAGLGRLRWGGERVGFVPTMGALHEGHLSLVRLAREQCSRVIVSIFVNPTQFGPHEDFSRYPRTPEKDLELLKSAQVDLVWTPTVSEMYGQGEMISIEPGPVATTFEGAVRPGHFRGVLTVVAKLFHQVRPDVALFGEKDAQQLFLIRKLASELQFPVEIIAGKTVREADGLAKSSRNVFLKQSERTTATALYRALSAGHAMLANKERETSKIEQAMAQVTAAEGIDVDYLTVVSEASFAREEFVAVPARLIGAVRLGSVRLIDNISYSA